MAAAAPAQSPGRGEISIPDLHAKAELQDFQRRHDSCAFPVLDEEEHAFGDMRVYWLSEAGEDGGEEQHAAQGAGGDVVDMTDVGVHELRDGLQSLGIRD